MAAPRDPVHGNHTQDLRQGTTLASPTPTGTRFDLLLLPCCFLRLSPTVPHGLRPCHQMLVGSSSPRSAPPRWPHTRWGTPSLMSLFHEVFVKGVCNIIVTNYTTFPENEIWSYILLTCHTVMRNPEIICFNWRVNAEQNLLNVRGPADWCFSQSLVSAIWNLLAILTKEENVKIQFAIITRHVHSVRDADPQLHLQAFLSKPFEAPPLLWIPPWKLTALVLLNCDMVHDSSSWDGW